MSLDLPGFVLHFWGFARSATLGVILPISRACSANALGRVVYDELDILQLGRYRSVGEKSHHPLDSQVGS